MTEQLQSRRLRDGPPCASAGAVAGLLLSTSTVCAALPLPTDAATLTVDAEGGPRA